MTETEWNEQARQERNRYFREYRAQNPDKMREIRRRYWQRRALRRAVEGKTENPDRAPERDAPDSEK